MGEMNQRDGIRYPAIDQLAGKTSSKYKLIVAVAKRAKQIYKTNETALDEQERHNTRPIGIALEEVVADKTTIL